MKTARTSCLKILILLGEFVFTEPTLAQSEAGEASTQVAANTVVPQSGVPSLLLTGIAAIGEQKFVYLSDTLTSQSIELVTGVPDTSGIELLKVQDEGLVACWRVLIRQRGTERWLNFAAPSQLNTSSSLAILIASSNVPAAPPADYKRPPAQNPGTMSNDTPSSAVRKRPVNSYPLPGGL